MTIRPAQPLDLPRNWAQPMIEAQALLRSANEWAEAGDMRAAVNCLERHELAIARAKKAMQQAGEGK